MFQGCGPPGGLFADALERLRVNQKGKILVVATLTHGLSQAGYEVIDADNGDDAILLAREHKPELALLDIRMEGKSGFDVAAYPREYCQIPFMFLSAFADEATIKQVKALGALTYLVKPLDIQQIVPAVAAALTDTSALAVGIVMHRYSLTRRQALERLQQQARQEGCTVAALGERLINAQEGLAGLGSICGP